MIDDPVLSPDEMTRRIESIESELSHLGRGDIYTAALLRERQALATALHHITRQERARAFLADNELYVSYARGGTPTLGVCDTLAKLWSLLTSGDERL